MIPVCVQANVPADVDMDVLVVVYVALGVEGARGLAAYEVDYDPSITPLRCPTRRLAAAHLAFIFVEADVLICVFDSSANVRQDKHGGVVRGYKGRWSDRYQCYCWSLQPP